MCVEGLLRCVWSGYVFRWDTSIETDRFKSRFGPDDVFRYVVHVAEAVKQRRCLEGLGT